LTEVITLRRGRHQSNRLCTLKLKISMATLIGHTLLRKFENMIQTSLWHETRFITLDYVRKTSWTWSQWSPTAPSHVHCIDDFSTSTQATCNKMDIFLKVLCEMNILVTLETNNYVIWQNYSQTKNDIEMEKERSESYGTLSKW